MRTLNIGRLNKRVTFYTRSDTVNELNQKSKKLTQIRTVWASVAPVRGLERYELQKMQEEVTYRIYTRYLADIHADLYIKYENSLYEIRSVIDVDLEHKMLEIDAVEIIDKGYVYE